MKPLAAILIIAGVVNSYSLDLSARFSQRTPIASCYSNCESKWIQFGIGNTHWLDLLLLNYDAYFGLYINDNGHQEYFSLDGIVGVNWNFGQAQPYIGIGPALELFLRTTKTDMNDHNSLRRPWRIYFFRIESGVKLNDRFIIPMGYILGGGYDLGIGLTF